MAVKVYALPDAEAALALRSALEENFADLIETSDSIDIELYDTFDWRLYNNKRMLVRRGNHLAIIDLKNGANLAEHTCRAVLLPKFSWNYPASDFRELLESLADIRGLICVAKLTREQTILRLLNEDTKTVGRVMLEKVVVQGQDVSTDQRVLVLPVKGYLREAKQAAKLLKANGLKRSTKPVYIRAIKSAGLNPGVYSPKVNIKLAPDINTRDAVKRLLAYLAGVMRLNEDGIRQDIDTEFLHDFRVSVRRSRSLLSQVKGAFDPQTEAKLKTDLRILGQLTGRLRDLDVYLLMQSHYETLVPEPLRPGVIRLFRSLKTKRRNELKKVVTAMESTEYTDILSFLESFPKKDNDTVSEPANALVPAIDTAKTVIFKRFRKVIKSGGKITTATPDEKIHNLRIECKKLRYLLEFFTSLFPAGEMKDLIKQLKILQDNLGTFNDLSVQQDFLYDYLNAMRTPSALSLQLAAATGGLIVRLNIEQADVRRAFFNVFKQFNSKNNRKRFTKLFT
ncbi:CHAD domain-containing protein [Desulfococcaceae bacterium HSG9]|nr:CHAD domain-containing protein [Desulfococcaceae bacterium HSG9]